jgi:hypothetical protein
VRERKRDLAEWVVNLTTVSCARTSAPGLQECLCLCVCVCVCV